MGKHEPTSPFHGEPSMEPLNEASNSLSSASLRKRKSDLALTPPVVDAAASAPSSPSTQKSKRVDTMPSPTSLFSKLSAVPRLDESVTSEGSTVSTASFMSQGSASRIIDIHKSTGEKVGFRLVTKGLLRHKKVVIDTVHSGSLLSPYGVQPGDVLQSINGTPVRDATQAAGIIAKESSLTLCIVAKAAGRSRPSSVVDDLLSLQAPACDEVACHEGGESHVVSADL